MPISNSIDHLFEVNPKQVNASVNFLDESVMNGEAKPYRVLCTIDASFIGIALLDVRSTKFVGIETHHFPKPCNTEQLSAKVDFLSEHSAIVKNVTFDKVSIQFSNNYYTFIPLTLFRKEDAEKYFFFNHSKKPQSKIETEKINGFDIVNIFSVNDQVSSSLKKVFNTFSVHHHITSLLQSVRLQSGKDNKRMLHVHFRSGWIDIIATEGRKLILCNSFNYKSVEDAVYYILLVCEQLSLNPHSVELVIMGELDEESAINKLMHKYIANIQFSERTNAAQFSYGFDKIPSHFYYSVFSHALCEL
jgi:hypothetical protein